MAVAGVTAAELDMIIVGTCSPDRLLPSAAAELQAALGATRAVAFDVDAACSGWLYGMQVAEGMMAAGNAETILVVGAELLSRIVNWKDRNTCVLFGDGAGAHRREAQHQAARASSRATCAATARSRTCSTGRRAAPRTR